MFQKYNEYELFSNENICNHLKVLFSNVKKSFLQVGQQTKIRSLPKGIIIQIVSFDVV